MKDQKVQANSGWGLGALYKLLAFVTLAAEIATVVMGRPLKYTLTLLALVVVFELFWIGTMVEGFIEGRRAE